MVSHYRVVVLSAAHTEALRVAGKRLVIRVGAASHSNPEATPRNPPPACKTTTDSRENQKTCPGAFLFLFPRGKRLQTWLSTHDHERVA